MKKKIIKVFLFVVAIMSITKNTNALGNVYYTTPNGIELSREEYNFLTTFFWDGYPDVMTEDQYREFIDLDLMNRDITIKKSTPQQGPIPGGASLQSTSTYQNGKTLQIGAACDSSNNTCYNSIIADWDISPTIRSYDVIGAYMTNASYISHGMTYVYSTSGTTDFYNLNTTTHGIGNSVKLPNTGEDILVNMIFTSTNNGRIYGSYQHAMDNTTLATSQLYTFSLGGYGNVFDFYGAASNVYDEMAGVDIDV